MKRYIFKAILTFGLLSTAAACDDYLEKEPTDIKTEKDIYSSFQQTEQQINRLYFWLKGADRPLAQMSHYSESPCCDEAECTSTSEANNLTNRFNEGDWGPDRTSTPKPRRRAPAAPRSRGGPSSTGTSARPTRFWSASRNTARPIRRANPAR